MNEPKEKLIEQARQHGRKIGYYLSVLDYKDDHQELIIEEMIELGLTGIENLAKFLELKYLVKQKGQANTEIKQKMDFLSQQLRQVGNDSFYKVLVKDFSN